MLTHPTLDKLRELRFTGMLEAFEEQLNNPDSTSLGVRGTPRPAGGPGADPSPQPQTPEPAQTGRLPADRPVGRTSISKPPADSIEP